MSVARRLALPSALLAAGIAAATVHGQQDPARRNDAPAKQDQVIRSRVDLVTSDLIVRDSRGMFVSDLKEHELEVHEDGVRQELITFTLSHGGRIFNVAAAPSAPSREGVLLPAARPRSDAAGRIFLLFVDDRHLDARLTPRVRDLFRRISKELIHDGDMFGIVSTGTSALEIDLTYDRKRLDSAIDRITGGGLKPREILEAPQGAQGSAEVRHNAHVAFSTAYDILNKLSQVHDRRKAFIYVSSGYDFNPFPETRAKQEAEKYGRRGSDSGDTSSQSQTDPFARGNQFGFADLASELAEVTRAANRANASIYAIDPRGLVAGADLDEQVDMAEWNAHVRTTQDTLRVLADGTGGFATVNQNDFDKALKRIDSETSDYYVIGYYSSNPDPLKRRRAIDIKVKRPGVTVKHRSEYFLRLPSAAKPAAK